MAEFVLTNKVGSLTTSANTAIFTAFTNSTGACRVRARFNLPSSGSTNRVLSIAVGIGGTNKLLETVLLIPGDSYTKDIVLKTSGDTLQAWQDVGTDIEYVIDGVDGLATS